MLLRVCALALVCGSQRPTTTVAQASEAGELRRTSSRLGKDDQVRTLFGSYGSEGVLLQNSWANLTSGMDVAATVAAFAATKQTLLGMFVDECAYFDLLVPMLQATQATDIRVFGVMRSHNGAVYCPQAWGTNASTTSGVQVNWTRVATQLAATSITYPHFIGFTIDDFYCMMDVPQDPPDPKNPKLPMADVVAAHRAMKAVAPDFMFMPTVYPEFLGVYAGKNGFTLGAGLGEPFLPNSSMASVSFRPTAPAEVHVPDGHSTGSPAPPPPNTFASVGFWVRSDFPYNGRDRHTGWVDAAWKGVLFLRCIRLAPDGTYITLLDVDLYEMVTCAATTNNSSTWSVQHCGTAFGTMYVNATVPGCQATGCRKSRCIDGTFGELHIELYARTARNSNLDQSKMTTISGVDLILGGNSQALGTPTFHTRGPAGKVLAVDNEPWSVAAACDGLLFCFAQNAGAVYTGENFKGLLSRAQMLTQGGGAGAGKQQLWALNYAWMSLGQPVGYEFSENSPAFLKNMMRWETEAGVDAVLAYNLRIETGRLASQQGIFTNPNKPSPAILAAAKSEGGWSAVVAGFWPEHCPTYGGFFQSWSSRHSVSGNLSFGINREWHATTTNDSQANYFFTAIIRVEGGPVLYRASTNVMPCTGNPLATTPRPCPGLDTLGAAAAGITCTVRCVASSTSSPTPELQGSSNSTTTNTRRRVFPETIALEIPALIPRPPPPPPLPVKGVASAATLQLATSRASVREGGVEVVANRLVLEFEMGGVGSWETQLLFAIQGSADEDAWHYEAGLRDPQLVGLYDAAVASFAELQQPKQHSGLQPTSTVTLRPGPGL